MGGKKAAATKRAGPVDLEAVERFVRRGPRRADASVVTDYRRELEALVLQLVQEVRETRERGPAAVSRADLSALRLEVRALQERINEAVVPLRLRSELVAGCWSLVQSLDALRAAAPTGRSAA